MKYITEEMFHRLYSAEKGELQPPEIMFINLTVDCPFNCKFCGKRSIGLSKNADYTIVEFIAIHMLGAPRERKGEIRELFDGGEEPLLKELKGDTEAMGVIEKVKEFLKSADPLDFRAYSSGVRDILKSSGAGKENIKLYTYLAFLINDRIYMDYKDRMSLEEYLRVVKEASELGVKRVYLSGSVGEPLIMKDDTMAVMKAVKDNGMEGTITTNGFYVDQEFADFAVDIGWDNVIISLDGATASTHDMLRGVEGAFAGVKNTLECFNRAKKEKGKDRPYLAFNLVINKKNFREIPDVIRFAMDNGVSHVSINPMTLHRPTDRAELVLSEEEEKGFWSIIDSIIEDYLKDGSIDTNIPDIIKGMDALHVPGLFGHSKALEEIDSDLDFLADVDDEKHPPGGVPLEKSFCLEPWTSITVETNGAVRICCFPYILLIDENVRKKSLRDIWYGRNYERIRWRMLTGHPPVECRYNCQPSIRRMQDLMKEEYRRIKEIYQNTRKASPRKEKFYRTIEGLMQRIGGEKWAMGFRNWMLRRGVRYMPLSHFGF